MLGKFLSEPASRRSVLEDEMEIGSDPIQEDLVELRLDMWPFQHHLLVVCNELCLLVLSLPRTLVLLRLC